MNKNNFNDKLIEYMIEGKQYIYKDKQASWIRYIKRAAEKEVNYQGEIERSIFLMKLIDSGKYSIEQLANYLKEDDLPGENICHVVTNILYYSKEGPAFFREFYKDCIFPPLEEIITKIEEENEYYKDAKEMKSQKTI